MHESTLNWNKASHIENFTKSIWTTQPYYEFFQLILILSQSYHTHTHTHTFYNRIHWRYDVLARVINPSSFFYSLFSGDDCIWSPCFLFITKWFRLDTSGETTSWMILVISVRLVCLLMVYSYFIMIIDQQNVGTFSDNTCSSTAIFILLSHGASISFFFWTAFLFCQTFLLLNLISLIFLR